MVQFVLFLFVMKNLILILTVFLSVTVFAKAPSSADTPKMENVAEALDQLPAEDAAFFFMNEYGPAADLVTPDDMFGYQEYINNSKTKPQAFINKRDQSDGGIAAFHNNIYAEGYYRMQAEKIAKLMKVQPWLEWNSSTKTYTIRHGNLGEKLFAPFAKNGEVTLYRGLSQKEVNLLLKLQKGDQSALNDLFSNRDGIFFTPDASKMSMWATDGVYIEIKLTQQDYNNVYAGIEFDYVEASIPADVIKRVIGSMVVHSVK